MKNLPSRGFTLIEAMAAMVVLSFGLLGVALLVLNTTKQNRVNYSQQQAYVLAERELERVMEMGCRITTDEDEVPARCEQLEALNALPPRSVFWSANGDMTEVAPAADAGIPIREYRVALDVDPPREGDEFDPLRQVNGQWATIYNVRVTVSWEESPTLPRRVVALQTRISP